MKKKSWIPYARWILLTEAVGALSGWLTSSGVKRFRAEAIQPPFTPPTPVFPVAWGILYALMGISAARVSQAPASSRKNCALNLYILQLAVNFLWSPIFFSAGAYLPAFFWLVLLWILVYLMQDLFGEMDSLAGMLQIPYLLWLTFAAYLNIGVWYLNR